MAAFILGNPAHLDNLCKNCFRSDLDRFWDSLACFFVSLESPFRDHDEVDLISAADSCRAQLNRVGRQRRAKPSLDKVMQAGPARLRSARHGKKLHFR